MATLGDCLRAVLSGFHELAQTVFGLTDRPFAHMAHVALLATSDKNPAQQHRCSTPRRVFSALCRLNSQPRKTLLPRRGAGSRQDSGGPGMSATLTLIDLAGAIALLLWGVHMVQSGIQRAFGPNLRRVLARALGDRLRASLAGLGVTALLQSSTATGLMAASFAAR